MNFFDELQAATQTEREALFGVPVIREAIADRIVHGILLPGEPLDEAGLAGEFGVSRTPVREAIRHMGLIVDFVHSVADAAAFCEGGPPHAVVYEAALGGDAEEKAALKLAETIE